MSYRPEKELRDCSRCLEPKWSVRAGRHSSRPKNFVYTDISGSKWLSTICPDCRKSVHSERDRARGVTSRDDSLDPRVRKARDAEMLVARHFEAQGYQVVTTLRTGPDLTCSKDGETFTVEVKSAIKMAVNGSILWASAKVMRSRTGDNLIAIVLPDGSIHIEPMSEHLLKCNKSGQRMVTMLVRQDRRDPQKNKRIAASKTA